MRFLVAFVETVAAIVLLMFTVPLLAAMRMDLHERNANDGVRWYPYDDDDIGEDVDEVQS